MSATTTQEAQFMQEALELAHKGDYTAAPNPRVGCVIVAGETIVGRGFHRRTGEPHAEIMALQHAEGQTQGATMYLTLEPCSHQGRTGPCTSAIVEAGIHRVVTAMEDPNPQVSGRGHAALKAAGIEWKTGIESSKARDMNRGFECRMKTGRPWVRVKQAVSLDGGSALADGSSQWISGEQARADVQRLRASSGAVLSTAATIRHDDARLNVRLTAQELDVDIVRQPLRVVLDRRGEMTSDLKFWHCDAPHVMYTLSEYAAKLRTRLSSACIEELSAQDHGLNLDQVLTHLATDYEINDVLVEAGPRFVGALLRQDLADELIVYIAPRLLGQGAAPLAELPGASELPPQIQWTLQDVRAFGSDIRATYYRNR